MIAPGSAPLVVMKFGGTSVASLARWEILLKIGQKSVARGEKPLFVCSAAAGISNLLESLAERARAGDHTPVLEQMRSRHLELARELGVDAEASIGEELEELERLALGASLIGEMSPFLRAKMLSKGELMLTRLGAEFLRSRGLSVAFLDARSHLLTEAIPATAPWQILNATCTDTPDIALQKAVKDLDVDLVLTQGFIATTPTGETALLGRGGSDTSAAYFGAKLQANRVEIWTDVPGMYTADPRQVPQARLLRHLGYGEAQEMATTGAKVLHPRCITPLRRHQIPLQIKCTQRPEVDGTLISSRAPELGAQVKSVSHKRGITLVSMETLGMWQQVGFLADVFSVFKKHGLSIDLVSTSETNVTASLDASANPVDHRVLDLLVADLGAFCVPTVIRNCAAVSLVGRQIRTILHKLAPALRIFEEHRIHLVSQAASDLNLTVVVDEDQAPRLVRQLHAELFAGAEDDTFFGPSWQSFAGGPVGDDEKGEKDGEDLAWWREKRDALLELARAQSPHYAYDLDTLKERVGRLAAMKSVERVFYAIKANSHPEILKAVVEGGLGLECVSPGELSRVFEVLPDLDPKRVLFTPNFARREEYEDAQKRGVFVTLDNLHPLQAWPEIFAEKEILLRLDPGHGRGHHAYVKTAGAQSKFGITQDDLPLIKEVAETHKIRIIGLHAHTGSGIRTPHNWEEVGAFLAEAARQFPDLQFLNLGGGLGVPEKPGQHPLDLEAVDKSLAEVRAAHPGLSLWMEPGRYVVAECGVLLARVNQTKEKEGVHYVGVDAGMNTLIRPALYGSYHHIVNLSRLDSEADEKGPTVHVVGPICETGDTLGYDRPLPNTQEGDILLVATAGAYGAVMSSDYNLRPRAAETLLR
jgi:diaminopimelate decarboxylase/aspartate kinase